MKIDKKRNPFKIATFTLGLIALSLIVVNIYDSKQINENLIQIGDISIPSNYINDLLPKLKEGNYVVCNIKEDKCSGFQIIPIE